MSDFNPLVVHHLATLPRQQTQSLADSFQKNLVVQFANLVPPQIADQLQTEAHTLLTTKGKRRELTLAATGGTQRSYTSVDRHDIHANNGAIRKFFESTALRTYLSKVAGEQLHPVPFAPEEYIINSQNQSGDTHGWHFDDYSYALIWVVDAPDPLSGGRIEYVNFAEWDKAAPRDQLIKLLTERSVQSIYVPSGTCYLMKARYVLHRVAPILNNTKRSVIVFTYASQADLNDATISHDTMEQIYDLPPTPMTHATEILSN